MKLTHEELEGRSVSENTGAECVRWNEMNKHGNYWRNKYVHATRLHLWRVELMTQLPVTLVFHHLDQFHRLCKQPAGTWLGSLEVIALYCVACDMNDSHVRRTLCLTACCLYTQRSLHMIFETRHHTEFSFVSETYKFSQRMECPLLSI
jgi:hypothetical protein